MCLIAGWLSYKGDEGDMNNCYHNSWLAGWIYEGDMNERRSWDRPLVHCLGEPIAHVLSPNTSFSRFSLASWFIYRKRITCIEWENTTIEWERERHISGMRKMSVHWSPTHWEYPGPQNIHFLLFSTPAPRTTYALSAHHWVASGQRHLFHLPLSCILFKNDHNESI